MTLVLHSEIRMDGSDAKSALKDLQREQASIVQSTTRANTATQAWTQTTQSLQARLNSTTTLASRHGDQVMQLAAGHKAVNTAVQTSGVQFAAYGQKMTGLSDRIALARHRLASWTTGMRKADESQKLAAGSVGNLVSQFNDIGVMMAAGQNPVQLALQQGTQITQVYGRAGAAQAIRMTGAALVSMVSPLNLITIGSIAAGAAMFQWLSSSSEEAETLDDVLGRVSQQMDDFRSLADMSASEMRDRWGGITSDVQALQRELQSLAMDQLLLDAAAAADTLQERLEATDLRRTFAASTRRLARTGRDQTFDAIQGSLEGIGSADSVDAQIAAVRQLQDVLKNATGGFNNMNAEQQAFYSQTLRVLSVLQEVKAASEAIPKAIRDQADEAAKAYLARQKEERTARQTIAQLQIEAQVREQIRQTGEGSVEVAELRLKAEREAYQSQLDSQKVSAELKAEMMQAWDAAKGVASVDMMGNITLATTAAHDLKKALLAARGAAT